MAPGHAADSPRRTVVLFVARFLLLFALAYGAYTLVWSSPAMERYLEWIARACVPLIGSFFDGLRRDGTMLWNADCTIRVDHGCDALLPSACFLAATLAFPLRERPAVRWTRRLIGLVLGLALLQSLNLVRIAALFAVGVHAPQRFDFAHETVGEGAFMLAVLLTWIAWARWSVRRPPARREGGDPGAVVT